MISFDVSRAPILIASFSGSHTDREFIAYLDQYDALLQEGRRNAVVLVTHPRTAMIRASHAKLQADWIAQRQGLLRERCVGISFVLHSVLMRGVLRAMLKMQDLPCPYMVHATETEGVSWARRQLLAEGIVVLGPSTDP